MNQLKNTITLILIIALANIGQSQNCYEVIADLSGFDTSPYQTELETAACELKNSFPAEFQNQFKVYDFGFYSQNEFMQGGFQTVWDKVVSEIPTDYYLIFGKQTDRTGIYTKFWVDIKLPSTGEFECLDILSETIREDIKTKHQIKANAIHDQNGKSPYNYAEVEKQIISSLKLFVEETIECCEPEEGFRSNGLCSACVFTPDELLIVQQSKNFLLDPVIIVSDPDYTDPPTALRGKKDSKTRSSVTPLNIDIKFQDDNESSLDEFINLYKSEHISSISARTGISTDISFHTYKYPRDCGFFEQTWQEYQTDNSEYKVFISIININNEVGVLGYHSTVSDLSSTGSSSFRSNSGEASILADEMEGIFEIQEEAAQPCEEFVGATANLIIARYGTQVISLQGPGSPMYQLSVHYDNLAKSAFTEAQYEMGIYWVKEYEAVKKEYDSWSECWVACSIRAKWRTTSNLCGGVIHTALDMCGLVPVLGEVCDGTNAVLYLISGDLKNASLSAVAIVPIAGYGANGIKYGGKLWKPLSGCASGGSGLRAGVTYCRMLTFTVTAAGKVKWRGGRSKMSKLMKEYLDMAGKEAHHLIPWELRGHDIMEILAKKGWHMSNPIKNGIPIPSNLHGNHPNVNNGVNNILNRLIDDNKITEAMTNSEVLQRMQKLTDKLSEEVTAAINSNTYINNHFANVNWDDIYDYITK